MESGEEETEIAPCASSGSVSLEKHQGQAGAVLGVGRTGGERDYSRDVAERRE
jgi:hypothetical protein